MIAVIVMVVVIIVITEPIEAGLGEGLHGGVNVSGGRGGRCGKGGRRLSTGVAAVVDAESQHSVLRERRFGANLRGKFRQVSWEICGRFRLDLGHYQRSKMILEISCIKLTS